MIVMDAQVGTGSASGSWWNILEPVEEEGAEESINSSLVKSSGRVQ